jgi:endoglucanase
VGSPHYAGESLDARGFDWASTGALGDLTLVTVETDLPAADLAAIRSAITATADAHLAQMSTMGHPAPYRTADGGYEWGSNGLVANNGVVLGLAYDLTSDVRYRDGAFAALTYLLGRNPMNYSYVSGYGDQPVRNVHHRHWANQLEPSLPIAPPGALSGGPNSALQDPIAARLLPGCPPQRCFVDHIEAYSLNEVTVNWNSALVWLSNWAAERAGTPPTTPADCTVTYSAHAWQTGLTANVTIKNESTTPWTTWELGFAFAGAEKVTNGWAAKWTQSASQVTAKNESWNGRVAPGATVTAGFNASNTGAHTNPTVFTLNGKPCR